MNDRYELIYGDCLEVLPTLADKSIDAVICDLPYGTTACAWDSVIPFEPMWKELKRIVKPKGAIVLFGSQPFTSLLIASNLKDFRSEWIWEKTNGGGFLNANRYQLKRHENILVFGAEMPNYIPQFSKGKRYACTRASAGITTFDQSVAGWQTINDGRRYPTSVLKYANETGLHPTQKPVELLRYLIRTYTQENETVLDFTMGSGTCGVACAIEKRKFIGIEKDAHYFGIAEARLKRALGQPCDIPQRITTDKVLPLFAN